MEIKKLKNIFRALFILSLGAFTNIQAAELSFFPNNKNILIGDSVAVDIVLSGLGERAASSVTAFNMEIQFESNILTPEKVKFSALLNNNNPQGSFQSEDLFSKVGQINIAETSLLEGSNTQCIICSGPYLDDIQPESFTLATLSFSAEAVGETKLNFTGVNLLGSDLLATTLDIDSLTSGSIIVAPANIPVPPSALLFVSSIFLMILKAKRYGS